MWDEGRWKPSPHARMIWFLDFEFTSLPSPAAAGAAASPAAAGAAEAAPSTSILSPPASAAPVPGSTFATAVEAFSATRRQSHEMTKSARSIASFRFSTGHVFAMPDVG